jgi:hypothetical protein
LSTAEKEVAIKTPLATSASLGSLVSHEGKRKMAMKSLILILLSAIFATASFGKIGDDDKQIAATYGQPGKDFGTRGNIHQVGYMAGGFMILVSFVNGVSQRESFGKPDTSALSGDDIQKILAFNAPEGAKWNETPAEGGDKAWTRSDNKAVAFFPFSGKFLSIQDANFVQPKE